MKGNISEKIRIYDKNIYLNNSPKCWSIVIMPDNILLDNFHHGYAHLHPDKKEIITKTREKTLEKVLNHLHENKKINFKQLEKELVK
jgi:trans-aconitate methyltransferase